MSFLIVANWKMGGNAVLLQDFLTAIGGRFALSRSSIEIVICPPFTAMLAFHSINSSVKLGAQNCFFRADKGCTGEISAKMLKECGCDYVILGHSDRRGGLGEKNSDVRLKAEVAIEEGIIPIICMGETLEERRDGISGDVLIEQCNECLPKYGEFVIAYEPIWAIGGLDIPDLDVIKESFDIIQSHSPVACPILYGGSVNQDNVRVLKSEICNLSGVLVGSAGTKIDAFCGVISNLLEL
ncbi:triosephosphate isomerase [Anaplasma capra]|uniref:triosephosphate isomerase n=1 Tax=Anaplasma capra TaxID=1562740 RepID=UPI0021D60464|nr:triosephosphate isomerase [Anaplasma capra]MCU7611678.1 triosephosphate isomerase [Anaplasma capra]